jgi:hypothetical protein
MRRLTFAAALLFSAIASPALADTIEVVFTGLAAGRWPFYSANGDYNQGQFFSKPFTADFVFDTDQGTLHTISPGSYQLDQGLVSAFIDLGDLGVWGGTAAGYFHHYAEYSFLSWRGDFSSIVANAGGYYQHLSTYSPSSGYYGGFQLGLCPTTFGGPCGHISSIESISFSVSKSVPGPMVGAGAPGLVFAFGGLIAWWRMRRPQFGQVT